MSEDRALDNVKSSLAMIDPQDKYLGTDLEGLDAFDRQLRRFEIYDIMEIKGDLTYARTHIHN